VPTYFGVCGSDGSTVSEDTNDSDTGCIDYDDDSFACPGSGNQNIQDLSVRCRPSGSCNVRLGVYSSDGSTLIAEGTGEVAISGAGYSWQGHMTQASVKAAGGSSPGVLVGGTSYRLAWTQDGGWYVPVQTGYGGIHYYATDYTGGMPANTSGLTGTWGTGRHHIRCGVDAAGGGKTGSGGGTTYQPFAGDISRKLALKRDAGVGNQL
jgi:hypothetical protein